ncbi:unnamed protein product [Paramecium sonneborni]|uniref:Uncharacterized protein n=1 Tax=Paramecium sonneborni TaxID=65129 RepID=A0A8S1PBU2_9CILI|nr:unnamed protein product [Paramecium sonneborni]
MGDLLNWEINDHNEIYIIKTESMKKSYEGIVKKLQKERVKYVKQQTSNEEHQQDRPISDLIQQFSQLKQEFMMKYQTKASMQRSQLKLKKRIELVQEQLKEQSKIQQQQQQQQQQQNQLKKMT